jgi:hypothetical protein
MERHLHSAVHVHGVLLNDTEALSISPAVYFKKTRERGMVTLLFVVRFLSHVAAFPININQGLLSLSPGVSLYEFLCSLLSLFGQHERCLMRSRCCLYIRLCMSLFF